MPEPAHTPSPKSDLRREMRHKLNLLTPKVKAAASAELCRRLLSNPRIADVHWLAAFLALPNEPDLGEFLRARLSAGRGVLLPRIVGKPKNGIMELCVVRRWDEDFVAGPLGIREPGPHCPAHSPSDPPIDVALVPGLAFDRDGNRMGKGAGHYDRVLAQGKIARTVGIGFLCQRVNHVPTEPHDIRLTEILLA
ncbi:MAG TPA: 5-formyltetrahydrofolate cyclo-ligase [Planctomycetota bacterium]|nr:5-formyltetrahydrofolate cyclo-ligase [Planctomycetota bacterium]